MTDKLEQLERGKNPVTMLVLQYDLLWMKIRDGKLNPDDVKNALYYLDQPREIVFRKMGEPFIHPWTGYSGTYGVLEQVAGTSNKWKKKKYDWIPYSHEWWLEQLECGEKEGRVRWKNGPEWDIDHLAGLLYRNGRGGYLDQRFDSSDRFYEFIRVVRSLRLSCVTYTRIWDQHALVPLTLYEVTKLALFGMKEGEPESGWVIVSRFA